jgi:hypothetical protein
MKKWFFYSLSITVAMATTLFGVTTTPAPSPSTPKKQAGVHDVDEEGTDVLAIPLDESEEEEELDEESLESLQKQLQAEKAAKPAPTPAPNTTKK